MATQRCPQCKGAPWAPSVAGGGQVGRRGSCAGKCHAAATARGVLCVALCTRCKGRLALALGCGACWVALAPPLGSWSNAQGLWAQVGGSPVHGAKGLCAWLCLGGNGAAASSWATTGPSNGGPNCPLGIAPGRRAQVGAPSTWWAPCAQVGGSMQHWWACSTGAVWAPTQPIGPGAHGAAANQGWAAGPSKVGGRQ